jgi:hypothetical protein
VGGVARAQMGVVAVRPNYGLMPDTRFPALVDAVAESLLATLAFELVMTHDWHTREEARRAILRWGKSRV